jgi:hypothetical protein
MVPLTGKDKKMIEVCQCKMERKILGVTMKGKVPNA